MNRVWVILLLVAVGIFSCTNTSDEVLIPVEVEKGFGPYQMGLSMLSNNSGGMWANTDPKVDNIPEQAELFAFIHMDFTQHAYQNYKAGKISQEDFSMLKNAWNWNPLPSEYSTDLIKEGIGVAAWYGEDSILTFIVDENGNYDFSDNKIRTLPSATSWQEIIESYNDSLLIQVEHELFENGKKVNKSTWVHINTFPVPPMSGYGQGKLILGSSIAENFTGEVELDGVNYNVSLMSNRGSFRKDCTLKIWPEGIKIDPKSNEHDVQQGSYIRLGEINYRFSDVKIGDKIVILEKSESITQGNNVGMIAIDFTANSISNQSINLSSYQGRYVYLDFWGTWCAPCVAELPKLMEVYSKHSAKNFSIIGIAKDSEEGLKKFLKDKNVPWPQIVQNTDSQIIEDYNISSYPTTFLIDPEGKIIAKNLRAEALDERLEKLLY